MSAHRIRRTWRQRLTRNSRLGYQHLEPRIVLSADLVLVSPGGESVPNYYGPAISGNGRYVAYESDYPDIVSDDNNGLKDVFYKDLLTNETVRVNVDMNGGDSNWAARDPSISHDGRYVAFASFARDLTSNSNGELSVFRRDMWLGETVLVSVAHHGGGADAASVNPSISANGRLIAFQSTAHDLLESGDTNGYYDIYLRDMLTGTTTLLSKGAEGAGNWHSNRPEISANGKFVTFTSDASDLVDDDNNESADIFVSNLRTGETVRASVSVNGEEGIVGSYRSRINANGRFITFNSGAPNLVEGHDGLFGLPTLVKDMRTGEVILASSDSDGEHSYGLSYDSDISYSGRFVAFDSTSEELVPEVSQRETHIYVKDLWRGTTTLLSKNSAGDPGNEESPHLEISGFGNQIVFDSLASNLVANDTNELPDVFLSGLSFPIELKVDDGDAITKDLQSSSNGLYSVNTLSVEREDSSTALSFSVDSLDIRGDQGALDSNVLMNMLSLDVTNGGSAAETLTWTFDSGNEMFGHLPFGETLELDFMISLTDSNGNHDVAPINIMIIGNKGIAYENSAFSTEEILTSVPDNKRVLLPGQTASFQNYSSYVHGINGFVIDLDLPESGNIGSDDFEFRFGNSDDFNSWTTINPAIVISVDSGAGILATDRITVKFNDGEITNGWLQTTFLASANTGLQNDDVFYFGNTIGETGNSDTGARVNLVDVALTRANQTGFPGADVNNRFDFDRNGRVDLVDVGIARSNQSGFSPMQLITPTIESLRMTSSDHKDDHTSGFTAPNQPPFFDRDSVQVTSFELAHQRERQRFEMRRDGIVETSESRSLAAIGWSFDPKNPEPPFESRDAYYASESPEVGNALEISDFKFDRISAGDFANSLPARLDSIDSVDLYFAAVSC